MSPKIFTPLDPQKLKCRGFEIWGHTEGPCPPIQLTPNYALWGVLDGWVRATKCPNASNPKVI